MADSVAVIDLGQERAVVVQQLMKAFEENGFFQMINHGISENLMDEAMKVYQEFYSLPVEEKAKYEKVTVNPLDKGVIFYKRSTQNFHTEYWRDILRHSCNASEEEKKTWPDNPPKYREVIRAYSAEMIRLTKVILDLVSEGLDLEEDYFDKQLGSKVLLCNHYPTCTNTSASPTLGMGGHYDPCLITILQQNVSGLQILMDGKWTDVEPLPHALVVNSGLALPVISNGKLTSAQHRVVTNSIQPRISIGAFISPGDVVEPAKSLRMSNPPLFKPINWCNEFIPHYFSKRPNTVHTALEPFKIDLCNE